MTALNIDEIARLAHETNRAYCASMGDMSQPSWEDAPVWQRASAIAGVRAMMIDPDMTPEASHESWSAVKVAEGWVYGETKDPEAEPPTHPCLVPYAELPQSQKLKDLLFTTIVRTCLAL